MGVTLVLWAYDFELDKNKLMTVESVLKKSISRSHFIFIGGCFQNHNDFIFLKDYIHLLKQYGITSIAMEFPSSIEVELELKNYLEDEEHNLEKLKGSFRSIFRSNGGKYGEFIIKAHEEGIKIFLIDNSEVMYMHESDMIFRKNQIVGKILSEGGFLEGFSMCL